MATKTASSVSTVAVFFAVVALALFTSRSDAFVSPPSVANLVLPYQQPGQGVHHHHHHHHRRRANDRSIPLYAATASGSDIGVINSWKLLPDGRIQGVMADSGDNVLTSPLKKQTGLKEESTVRTVSGSRYRLGTPAAPDDNGNSNDNDTNMSPDRLGTPRATVPGVNMPGANGDETPVRATQPLRSAPTASQDRVLNEYVANKGRATIPVSESSGSAPEGSTEKEKKNRFLTPLVGGASAIAVGAAIGSGVVSDKGLDFDKLKNLPDPSKILESTKSLGLPDIKALRAPAIPSDGISLPKFEGLSLPSPKLPDVGIPDVGLKLPDVKLPSAPSVKINVPNGVKNLGDAAGDAIGEALDGTGLKLPSNPFEKKPQTPPSVGMGPYKVPMPYLDQQIVQAKREAAEKEEAARIQKIKEEEQARVKAEEEAMAQRAREREQALKERAEAEALIRKQAEERVQKAEQETARLRTEAEKEAARLRTEAQQEAARLRTQAEQETARLRTLAEQETARLRAESEKETARLRSESEQVAARLRAEVEKTRAEVEKTRMDAMAKEKAAADESARLKKEVESALLKERAAKEEFSEKLKAAEVAQLNQAQDFTAKLAAAQEAAAKERALAEETILAQKLAAEAATREEEAREALETATVEARQASIGAMAARKATYAKPSLSTYAEWQQRQQVAYEARIKQAGSEIKATTAASSNSASPSSQDNLSTYKRWQQSVLAKQVVSLSAEPVTAAYATGAPAPVANQLISGSSKLSEFATRLNGDLGYTIAGSAALIGGITYGYNYQKIQDEIEQAAETQSSPTNENVAPPSPPVKPLTPVVPPTPKVQPKQEIATSVTMAIDPKPTSNDPVKTSASVTKEVSPRPAKGSYSPFSGPSKSTEPVSATVEAIEPQAASVSTAEVKSNTGSYLDSMSKVSDGTASPKTSFSPFANPKKTASNDSLYKPPSGELSSAEERVDDPLDSDVSESAAAGPSYLDSMSAPSAGLKSSYSPFGTPKAPAKDSLYDPPVSVELPSEKDESSPADETNDFVEGVESPANGGSYFDSMAKTNGSGAAAPKASYSPFGATKTWQTSSDSLYDVPLAVSEESSTNEASTTESLEAVTSSQGSYLTGLDDSNAPSGVKKSYSPFGTKPKAVRDNGLYSPGNS